MYYLVGSAALCMTLLYIVNNLIIKLPNMSRKAHWYLLHFFTNLIVVAWTAPYVYIYLTNVRPEFTEASIEPSIVVMSLHLFHGLAYKLSKDDIIHHVIMLLLLCIPLYNYLNTEFVGVTNYCLFFLCGLPGGIDYYLMYLVETKCMMKLTEKRLNRHLNSWIRSVGILYGAFICYQGWLTDHISLFHMIPTVLVLTWNAQYYNSLVSLSYGYHLAIADKDTSSTTILS